MSEITLSIEIVFKKRQTSLSMCAHCETIIYTDEYWLVLKTSWGKIVKTDNIFCSSCYDLYKEEYQLDED